ncbi:MAG: flavodoxin family protein [bacterium]|nr:flavodoxin family protein [bacterium]
MKEMVLAVNGSGRKNGNTAALINTVFEELQKENIKTEMIQMAGQRVRGCTGCMKCFENKNKRCVFSDDGINDIIAKMAEADGIILGSPTYFCNVSTEMKALIDRAGLVGIANDALFKRKAGAAVVAVRRAGAVHVFNSINSFFTISQMIIPGSTYWNLGVGLVPGDVEKDEEGLRTMRVLGQNMAWLLQKINV